MNTHAKLFMTLLTTRIYKYLELCPSLTSNQAGFLPHRSTLEQILTLKEVLLRRKLNSNNTYVAFVDIAKAYDSVSHPLLFHKLS